MSTKTFSVFYSSFKVLLHKLDMEYWSTHCGVDGYLYMLFQRRFLQLTIYMTIISIIVQGLLYIFDKDYQVSLIGLTTQS
jgi:hypothetical protein